MKDALKKILVFVVSTLIILVMGGCRDDSNNSSSTNNTTNNECPECIQEGYTKESLFAGYWTITVNNKDWYVTIEKTSSITGRINVVGLDQSDNTQDNVVGARYEYQETDIDTFDFTLYQEMTTSSHSEWQNISQSTYNGISLSYCVRDDTVTITFPDNISIGSVTMQRIHLYDWTNYIVGTWSGNYGGGANFTITFGSDGKYLMYYQGGPFKWKGNYTINGDGICTLYQTHKYISAMGHWYEETDTNKYLITLLSSGNKIRFAKSTSTDPSQHTLLDRDI